MLKENSVLRKEARDVLGGNWAMAAVAALIYMAIASVCSYIPLVGWLVTIVVCLPIGWGANIMFYQLYRERKLPSLDSLFIGFHDFGRILGTTLLVEIYTFLWTLLLIVPGIIKGCSYAMTPYILRDYPELSYNAAIEKSMAMMEGHKMKLFLLYLSFIGWAILCILTLGLGYLLLMPYVATAQAAFYEDLKAQAANASEETVQV